MATATYTLDNAWINARERLALLEQQIDPATIDHCERIGVAEGWHCLEVGAGGGSIAVWLSRRVGPSGQVVATDLNTRFLGAIAAPNLQGIAHDVVADELAREAFDLVHTRFLLIHLPEREAVLAKLAAAVKPGGWLLIEEPDDTDFDPDPSVDPSARDLYRDVLQQLHTMSRARGLDIRFGAQLFGRLRAQGFPTPRAEGRTEVVPGGSPEAEFWRLTFEQFAAPLVAAGLVSAAKVASFLSLHDDPSFALRTSLVMTAWGRKPDKASPVSG